MILEKKHFNGIDSSQEKAGRKFVGSKVERANNFN